MDSTAQAVLVGAISGGIVAILVAFGKFIFDNRSSQAMAKQTDLDRVEGAYKRLQQTYEATNAQLNLDLAAERNARNADRLECERQIETLRQHVLELTRKLPEPGFPMPVIIAAIDTKALPALPVVITGPLPIQTTPAERAAIAAAIAAADTEKES